MTNTEYMRALSDPYWCRGSPLRWEVGGMGIAHLAMEGLVGQFNLSYLMLQKNHPPASQLVYRSTDLRWVLMLSGGTFIAGRSLEHHASIKSLQDFSKLVLPYTHNRTDFPGSVPWGTLGRLLKGVLA